MNKHLFPGWSEYMKIMVGIFSVLLCGCFVGSSVTAGLTFIPRPTHKVDQSLFFAIKNPIAAAQTPSQDIAVALHAQKLEQMQKAIDAEEADRAVLHNEIAKSADAEVRHYNELATRLDILDTKLMMIYSAGGLLLGLCVALQTAFHALDLYKKRGQTPAR